MTATPTLTSPGGRVGGPIAESIAQSLPAGFDLAPVSVTVSAPSTVPGTEQTFSVGAASHLVDPQPSSRHSATAPQRKLIARDSSSAVWAFVCASLSFVAVGILITILQGYGTITIKEEGRGWGHLHAGVSCSLQVVDGVPPVLLPVDIVLYPRGSTACVAVRGSISEGLSARVDIRIGNCASALLFVPLS